MLNAPAKTTRYVTAISLLIVFTIDVFTPAEFGVDILYLCCILLVFKQNTGTIIGFAIAASVLIVADAGILYINHKLQDILAEVINRAISVTAILIASYGSINYRKLNKARMLQEQQYLTDLKEMLFMTSHQVRKPLANILGLIEIINMDTDQLSHGELKTRAHHLHASAEELDGFINQLNEFIEQIEKHTHL